MGRLYLQIHRQAGQEDREIIEGERMRQIKFRAWDKENKKMIFGGFVIWADGDIFTNDDLDNRRQIDGINLIPMQFTGLLDKNGKEIYEGDEIKCEDLYCEVKWDEFECGWCFDSDGRSICIRPEFARENWEIIGNIYEDSKLLEAEAGK